MHSPTDLTELIDLWTRTIGNPPSVQQFEIWMATHTPDVIKIGIIKTATKNAMMGGLMSVEHRVKFASKVMLMKTYDPQKHEGQGLSSMEKEGTSAMS